MDTKLEAFVTIVECGSFTSAAEKLYTSQSALSQQIKTLEKQLGFPLFVHQSRRMALTQAGKSFYPHAKQLLIDYANAVREGRYYASDENATRTRLRIGCLGEQFFHIWKKILSYSEEIQEMVTPVCMRYSSRNELYRTIGTGRLDITFQLEDPLLHQYGLPFVKLTSYPLLCVPMYVPHPLDGPLTLEDLLKYRICFHYRMGNTLYEDKLRHALRTRDPYVSILEPDDFFSAEYGIPSLVLVPSLDYTGDYKGVVPLTWEEEIPAGFIHGPNPSAAVLHFEQWILEHMEG